MMRMSIKTSGEDSQQIFHRHKGHAREKGEPHHHISQPGTSQSIDDDYDHDEAYNDDSGDDDGDDNGDDNDDPYQVLQVKAVDGDRGIGNPITYSITGGPDHLFAVNKLNGLVYVNVRLVLFQRLLLAIDTFWKSDVDNKQMCKGPN